jgi:Spy/CpxP family protein refolding chaperone
MPRPAALLLLAAALAAPAAAQSPYTGLERRPPKALSPEQVEDLLRGRGAGLALAAELNGYPGPMHVLEHAVALGLDSAQEAATRALHARMAAEARDLGARLVEEERALDAALAARAIGAAELDARLARIGALQGALRAAHMRAHLEQAALLSPAQAAAYGRLRGYGAAGGEGAGGGGHHQPRRGH